MSRLPFASRVAALPVLSLLASALLAACGGGGDSSTPNATASAASITVQALNDAPAQSSAFILTVAGPAGPYHLDATVDDPSLQAHLTVLSPWSASVAVAEPAPGGPGTRSATLTARVCADSSCNPVLWSHAYPVTRTRFQVSPVSLALSAPAGQAASATLSVTPADTGHVLQVDLLDVSTLQAAGWATADLSASDRIVLTADAATLPVALYGLYLDIGFAATPRQVRIPASFDVTPAP